MPELPNVSEQHNPPVQPNPIQTQRAPPANIYMTPSTLPKQPHTFQFKSIRDVVNEIYYRLRGQRTVVTYKPIEGKEGEFEEVIKREDALEPIVSEWGANRLVSFIYPLINEQTPFANLSNDVIVGLFGKHFAKTLNNDLYRNFELYFSLEDKDGNPILRGRAITNYFTTLKIISMMAIEIMSRSISGIERQNFYEGQRFSGVIPASMFPQQI